MLRLLMTTLDFQTLSDFFCRKARYTDHFIPAGLAGCNSNGGTRQVQKLCEKIYAGFVGFAVHGGGCEGEFQRVAYFTGDGILLRARVDLDRESGTGGRILNCYHRRSLQQGARRYTGETLEYFLAFLCVPCAPCG